MSESVDSLTAEFRKDGYPFIFLPLPESSSETSSSEGIIRTKGIILEVDRRFY